MTSRLHPECFFLATLLVLIRKAPLLGKSQVWAASCPLFTGESDPVVNFSATAWGNTEGHTSCFST